MPIKQSWQLGVNLIANAITSGNGGNVVVWSNDFTGAYGSINAEGGAQSGNGGFIETSSHNLLDVTNIAINTSAANGIEGTWLLDPANVTIESNGGTNSNIGYSSGTYTPTTGASTSILDVSNLVSSLASTNINVTTSSTGTGNGDITVANAITWTGTSTLTLTASNHIYLNAAITALNGGLVLSAVNSAKSITSGTESSPSSTGVTAAISVANFNLLKGQWYQVNSTLPTFSVTNNFQIDSGVSAPSGVQFLRATSGSGTTVSPYVITDVYGLEGMGSSATTEANSFSLGNNIDATATSNWNSGVGFVPVGNSTNFYTGTFNGQNHTISNLYINSSASAVGLFGKISAATLENVSLLGIEVISTSTSANGAGGLVGLVDANSTISNIYVSGSITGATNVGGIAGWLQYGTLSNSHNSASIDETAVIGNGGSIGGLAGANIIKLALLLLPT